MEEQPSSFKQAEAYDRNQSTYQRQNGKRLIELLAPEKGNKILDIGCGTGYLTKLLADLVGPEGKVVGVDPDLPRLKVAREKYSADNLEYLEGTAECIPVDDSDFDIVFSNYVFHWCKDKDRVFKQVMEKLKSGGKFGFVVVDWEDMFETEVTPELVSQEYREAMMKIFHSANQDQYEKIASNHRFTVLTSETHVENTKYNNVSEVIEFYMTHLHGKFDKTHFNAEAMRQKYGEGKFTHTKKIVTCTVKLGCK